MQQPYVSSFLGFREVEFYKSMLDELNHESPECMPQVCGQTSPTVKDKFLVFNRKYK